MANSHHNAGTLTVKGHEYQVFVDDEGAWISYHNGQEVKTGSKDKLRKDLERLVRAAKVSVSVPFTVVGTTYHGPVFARSGVATGLHSGNGNVLVRWPDGQAEQLQRYGNTTLDASADPQEWLELAREAAAAQEKLKAYEQKHALQLHQAVREAVDAALKGEEA